MRPTATVLLLALAALVPGAPAQDPPLREAYPADDFSVREAMVP